MTIIKEVLKSLNMSQNKLSQLARIPSSNLSLIANGKAIPCASWRKRISEVLNVPDNILFPNTEVK